MFSLCTKLAARTARPVVSRRFLSTKKPRSTSDKVGIAAFLGVAGITTYLGIWQAKRYFWKLDLIEERKEALQHESISLNEVNEATLQNYERINAVGKFDLANLAFVGPRNKPRKVSQSTALSPIGYFVVAPFVTQDRVLLVNVGWISRNEFDEYNSKHPRQDNQEKMTDEIKIEAITTAGETGSAKAAYGDNNRLFLRVDLEEIEQRLGFPDIPIYVTMIEEGNEKIKVFDEIGLHPSQRKAETFMNFNVQPETHMGYSLTWFGISAACLAVIKGRFL